MYNQYSQINTAKTLVTVATRELGLDKYTPKHFIEEGMSVFLKPDRNDIMFRILLEFEVELDSSKKIEDLFFAKFYELKESIIESPVIQNEIKSYSLQLTDAARKIDSLTRELEVCKAYKTYFEKQFLLSHGKEYENKT